MEKILTIVIPTYNMQDYLRRCLDSLIVSEEQMQLLEVLVVNDGSRDNSSTIAHEYQDKYPDTFRVIDKENGNYGSCVNRGLKEATGKYIKILDADDWFETLNFCIYIDFLKERTEDLVFNDCEKVTLDGNNNGYFVIPKLKACQTYDFHVLADMMIFPQMHNIAYKTCILKDNHYFQTEGISYTDQEWDTLPMKFINNFVYFKKIIYKYVIGREGQTMDKSVMNRSFANQKKIAYSLLQAVEYVDKKNIHNDYIKQKTASFLAYLYLSHILYGFFDYEEFKQFDFELQNKYSKIYDILNNHYIYIKLWSKNNKFSSFLLNIYFLLKHK